MLQQTHKTKILSTVIAAAMFILLSAKCFAGSTEALRAINTHNSQALTHLLEQGLDPNTLSADGSSLLAWAVESQNAAMVKLLLDFSADPNNTNASDQALVFSPLIIACQLGDSEIVEMLMQAGADLNVKASQGVSALSLCAAYSSPNIVEAMINASVDINASDSNGQSPLMWAAAEGRTGTLQLLLEKGAKLHHQTTGGFTALFFAIKSRNPSAVHLLLDAGADAKHVLADGTSAVKLAMYQKQYEIAARLIQQGVDLEAYDRNGNTLLHAAVLAKQSELVSLLLKAGANPNVLSGTSEVVWRYEVNFTSAPYVVYAKTPLLLAAENGYSTILKQLVSAGADTSFQTENGTSIVLAAARSNPETLKAALALNPDANVTNKSGRTPLHLLLSLGTENPITDKQIASMFKLLHEHGARIDIADKNGQTAAAVAQRDQYRSKSDFTLIFNPNNEVSL